MAHMSTRSSFSSTLPRLPHVPYISPTCPTSEVLLIFNLRVHFPFSRLPWPRAIYRLPQRPNRDDPSLTQPRDMRNTQPLFSYCQIAN